MGTSVHSRGWWSRLLAPLRLGKDELVSMMSKLGGALTLSVIRRALLQRLGVDVVRHRLRYETALRAAYHRGLHHLRKRLSVEVGFACTSRGSIPVDRWLMCRQRTKA